MTIFSYYFYAIIVIVAQGVFVSLSYDQIAEGIQWYFWLAWLLVIAMAIVLFAPFTHLRRASFILLGAVFIDLLGELLDPSTVLPQNLYLAIGFFGGTAFYPPRSN